MLPDWQNFCCDNLWKSIIMALEKPGKLWEFFSATLWPPFAVGVSIRCRVTVYAHVVVVFNLLYVELFTGRCRKH